MRLKRISYDDKEGDAKTNKMANLFPDQYKSFYVDTLVDGLLGDPCGSYKVVTNSSFLMGCVKSRYPLAKLDVIEEKLSQTVIRSLGGESADLLVLDLSLSVIDAEEEKLNAKFHKTWSSPLRSQVNLGLHLAQILSEMNDQAALNALIRIPVVADPLDFYTLIQILSHPYHRVKMTLSHSMHELYFDLVIFPVSEKHLTLPAVLMSLSYSYCRFAYGVIKRHDLWLKKLGSIALGWKSERYKHLTTKNYILNIDMKKTRIVREIVTRTMVRKVKDSAKIKRDKRKKMFDRAELDRDQFRAMTAKDLSSTVRVEEDLLQCAKCRIKVNKKIAKYHDQMVWHPSCLGMSRAL